MIYFNKIFKIPGPKDLGMSDNNNVMASKFFPNAGGDVHTWESYYETVSIKYPFRFFLSSTLPGYFISLWNKFYRPVNDFIYYVKCHTLKSHRFHMLDLRQPLKRGERTNYDAYRYGWVDVDVKILYAIFNLLGEYLNKESPSDLSKYYTLDQINSDPHLKLQHDSFLEAKAIYHWWTVERLELEKIRDQLLTDWSKAHRNQSSNTEHLWQMMNQVDNDNDKKTEEMIARLMKIRRTLWT